MMTGRGDDLNVLESQEIEINVTSSILTFMTYAMKSAAIYAAHCGREVINTEDIKRAMMVEVFLYFDREDLGIRVAEWRQQLLVDAQNDNGDEEEDSEEDNEEDNEEENEEEITDTEHSNNCECDICSQMKNIRERWEHYNPTDGLGKIFKSHIDSI